MLEIGRIYRGYFEKRMMCMVLDIQHEPSWHGHPPRASNYLLLWLTTSGNPDARDVAGKTEWETAPDAENYLKELPWRLEGDDA